MFKLAAEPKRWISVRAPPVALVGLEPGAAQQMPCQHALHHLQHWRHQLWLRGQQQAQRDR